MPERWSVRNSPKSSSTPKSVLLAPRVIAAARQGDDALLRSIVDLFEREGFHVVGVAEAAPNLIADGWLPGPRSAVA